MRDATRISGMCIDYTNERIESVSHDKLASMRAAACIERIHHMQNYSNYVARYREWTRHQPIACNSSLSSWVRNRIFTGNSMYFLAYYCMPTKVTPRYINREMIAVSASAISKVNNGQHKSQWKWHSKNRISKSNPWSDYYENKCPCQKNGSRRRNLTLMSHLDHRPNWKINILLGRIMGSRSNVLSRDLNQWNMSPDAHVQ